jgi:hypothetical protein
MRKRHRYDGRNQRGSDERASHGSRGGIGGTAGAAVVKPAAPAGVPRRPLLHTTIGRVKKVKPRSRQRQLNREAKAAAAAAAAAAAPAPAPAARAQTTAGAACADGPAGALPAAPFPASLANPPSGAQEATSNRTYFQDAVMVLISCGTLKFAVEELESDLPLYQQLGDAAAQLTAQGRSWEDANDPLLVAAMTASSQAPSPLEIRFRCVDFDQARGWPRELWRASPDGMTYIRSSAGAASEGGSGVDVSLQESGQLEVVGCVGGPRARLWMCEMAMESGKVRADDRGARLLGMGSRGVLGGGGGGGAALFPQTVCSNVRT